MGRRNLFDIQYDRKLNYIFPLDFFESTNDNHNRVAVFAHLYYENQVERYIDYLGNIPRHYDLYLISSQDRVIKSLKKYFHDRRAEYILKNNCGRDISALLIECSKYVYNYKYACFLHDKKAHLEELSDETDLWIENLWGNLLGSESYINRIIEFFDHNNDIGVAVPPPPVGDHFAIWQGFGWQGAFDVTKELCDRLELSVDIDINKPPLAIGTALWFRVEALKKLFDYPWKYEDFNDADLINLNYLSYGIERIFPFVAQDAGYLTAEVMNTDYASIHNSYLKYTMPLVFNKAYEYFPFLTVHQIEMCEKNLCKLLRDVGNNDKIYLYGAGNFGRFCLNVLRRNHIEPIAFVVSDMKHEADIDNLPVCGIDELYEEYEKKHLGAVIVITVENRTNQNIIAAALLSKGISNIVLFWREE